MKINPELQGQIWDLWDVFILFYFFIILQFVKSEQKIHFYFFIVMKIIGRVLHCSAVSVWEGGSSHIA